ncbi:hypothetical protein BKA70DRAFT_1285735, partial [Coprinopsis sp. MPI-PUGE-AT-0042]
MSPAPIPTGKDIPPKLIYEAGQGEVLMLQLFAEAIITDNFSWVAFQVPLNVLRNTRPPSRNEDADTTRAVLAKAVLCFCCLNNAIVVAKKFQKQKDKSKAIVLLSGGLETVVSWFVSTISLAALVCTAARISEIFIEMSVFLNAFLQLDDRLARSMLTAPRVVETLLLLWSLPNPEDPYRLYHTWRGQGACYIGGVMDTLIKNEDGLQVLCDALLDSPLRLKRFCRATCSRIEQVGDAARRYGISSETTFKAFAPFLANTKILEVEPVIYLALQREGYFHSLAITIRTLHGLVTPEETVLYLSGLMARSMDSIGNPISAQVDVFKSGLLVTALEALSETNGAITCGRVAPEYLSHFRLLAFHPRLLLSLRDSISRAHVPGAVSSKLKPAAANYLGVLMGLLKQKLDVYVEQRERGLSNLCDNHTHHSLPHERSKTCSGCHVVVYCSSVCQREDWKKRHRGECAAMKQTFIKRKTESLNYSQASRCFHLGLAKLCCPEPSEFLEDLEPVQEPESIVKLVDVNIEESRIDMQVLNLDEYLPIRIEGDCPALEARADELIRDFGANFDPRVFLMEFSISWSLRRRIALLIEFKLLPGALDWEVGRSVARFQHWQM